MRRWPALPGRCAADAEEDRLRWLPHAALVVPPGASSLHATDRALAKEKRDAGSPVTPGGGGDRDRWPSCSTVFYLETKCPYFEEFQ